MLLQAAAAPFTDGPASRNDTVSDSRRPRILGRDSMASPEGPTEAVLKLLSEELRTIIRALPEDLQESVPERLRFEAGVLAGAETCMELDLDD